MIEATVRIRMNQSDAHYGGNLVDGARLLGLFGDVATEILIRHDGDEGLFVAYDMEEFTAPVYAGDYIEATAKLDQIGNTSRKMIFEARKVIEAGTDPQRPYRARILEDPEVVCRASGTCVVPKGR